MKTIFRDTEGELYEFLGTAGDLRAVVVIEVATGRITRKPWEALTALSDETICPPKQVADSTSVVTVTADQVTGIWGSKIPTPFGLFENRDTGKLEVQRDDAECHSGQTDDSAAITFVRALENGTPEALQIAQKLIDHHA